MSKTQLYEIIFITLFLAILIGLILLILFLRRRLNNIRSVLAIKITLISLLIIEYIILSIWIFNAVRYEMGYHRIVIENWLERNQLIDELNTIQTPYWWLILVFITLTFHFDKKFLKNRKSFVLTLITIIIPFLIILAILAFNYFMKTTYPDLEFHG